MILLTPEDRKVGAKIASAISSSKLHVEEVLDVEAEGRRIIHAAIYDVLSVTNKTHPLRTTYRDKDTEGRVYERFEDYARRCGIVV